MPCLVLLVGALFLKAFSTWIQNSSEHKSEDSPVQTTVTNIKIIMFKQTNAFILFYIDFRAFKRRSGQCYHFEFTCPWFGSAA